jgi:mono/diheme cytochrome c family protein
VRRFVVIALALLVPLFVVACGSGEDKTTAPDTVEGALTGEAADTGATDTGGTETGGTETGGTETGGGEGEGDPEAGKAVFESAGCGSCHVLEEAGSTGTVGPNLDDAQLEYEAAHEQIAEGGGGMPAFKDQLDEQQIADVTAFVVESSGG